MDAPYFPLPLPRWGVMMHMHPACAVHFVFDMFWYCEVWIPKTPPRNKGLEPENDTNWKEWKRHEKAKSFTMQPYFLGQKLLIFHSSLGFFHCVWGASLFPSVSFAAEFLANPWKWQTELKNVRAVRRKQIMFFQFSRHPVILSNNGWGIQSPPQHSI